MGFAIGIVIYTICCVALMVMRGYINSESTLRDFTNSRLLGGFYIPIAHKGLSKLLHSGFVDRRRYANKGSVEEQVARAISTIDSVCEHASVTDVYVLNISENAEKATETVDSMASGLSSLGIKAHIIDVGANTDERLLLPVRNAILLAANNTKTSDVWTIANLTRAYDIAQLGCVYIREY